MSRLASVLSSLILFLAIGYALSAFAEASQNTQADVARIVLSLNGRGQ